MKVHHLNREHNRQLFSGDHIIGDHRHTDITKCNIEEPQENYALERSVIEYGGLKLVLLDPTSRPLLLQWVLKDTLGQHHHSVSESKTTLMVCTSVSFFHCIH